MLTVNNNFLDVMNLVSTDTQDKSSVSKSNEPKADFKDFLDKSVNSRANERALARRDDAKRAQRNEDTDTNEVRAKDKPDTSDKVQKNDRPEAKDNKTEKRQDLSEEDKKLIKQISDKLGVDEKTVLNLLQALNIDLNNLKLNLNNTDIDTVVSQIKEAVENTIQGITGKLDASNIQDADKSKSLESKIHLVVNIHNKEVNTDADAGKKVEVENIHLNLKIQQTGKDDTQKVQADQNTQQGQEITNDDQAKVVSLDSKRTQANETDDTKVSDGTQQLQKQSVQVKHTDNNAGQFAQNQDQSGQNQSVQEQTKANNADVKGKDAIAEVIQNAKVINLKTNSEQPVSTDSNVQNVFSVQQQDSPINRFAALKHTAQVVNNQKENVFSQIVENAKLTLTDKQTEMEMNLKPESLGKLSLKIATENGLVVAKFTAESQQVKEIIESNLNQLKEHLQQQGLNIQEFSVNVGQDSRREMFNNQRFGSPAGRTNRTQNANSNTITASENYLNRQVVRNPYLVSQSSIDFTA